MKEELFKEMLKMLKDIVDLQEECEQMDSELIELLIERAEKL